MTLAHCLRRIALPLVVTPSLVLAQDLTQRQTQLLLSNCVQCHARPGIGAPQMGSADDWKQRIVRGEDDILVNVVQGLRGMPPLGYCSACTEQDFRALIRLITGAPATAK